MPMHNICLMMSPSFLNSEIGILIAVRGIAILLHEGIGGGIVDLLAMTQQLVFD